jgi:KipI family sensor histidine kinase inhibitor
LWSGASSLSLNERKFRGGDPGVAGKAYPRLLTAGDGCVVVEFGDSIDMKINCRVAALDGAVRRSALCGLLDTVPTYRSLAVYFDPLKTDVDEFLLCLEMMCGEEGPAVKAPERRTIVVPTLYGGDSGPDLADVAAYTGLSSDEVIFRHTANPCYCYMLGFTPGFPYLGGMDPGLEVPRLDNPREVIPAGSVAIGGKQTGIYPIASPGGWRLIGRTPMRVFDPDRDPPIFLEAGMWVRFRSIERDEFEEIEAASSRMSYFPEISDAEAAQ